MALRTRTCSYIPEFESISGLALVGISVLPLKDCQNFLSYKGVSGGFIVGILMMTSGFPGYYFSLKHFVDKL